MKKVNWLCVGMPMKSCIRLPQTKSVLLAFLSDYDEKLPVYIVTAGPNGPGSK